MNEYTIIQADIKKNKDDIFNILKNNFEDQSIKRFEWNYENCPYGQARCWLAKDEKSNTFVGSSALFLRKILLKGRSGYAAVAGDFAVDKDHRAFGPAIKMQKEIQSSLPKLDFKFIYGSPNKSSRPLYYRIGYKKLGEFEKYIKILKLEGVSKKELVNNIQSRFGSRSKIIPRIFKFIVNSKILIKFIDFYLKIKSKERHYKNIDNYTVELPESFDNRFDTLWNKVKKQFDIIGERRSKYLNWRFLESIYEDYKIFCLSDNKKDLIGYIVYYSKDQKFYITDMLFLNRKSALESLLAEFILFTRTNNGAAIILNYLGNSEFLDKIKEFKFLLREVKDEDIIIYSNYISQKPELIDKNNYHFFESDLDL